jgi:hypothetical protein
MCTKNDNVGKAVAVKVAEVQNMARHVLVGKDGTGAVCVRAALELAVKLGRGDESTATLW